MSEYGYNDWLDYLAHGVEWKNHKYIMRIGRGPGARYFYTPRDIAEFRNRFLKAKAGNGKKVADKKKKKKKKKIVKKGPVLGAYYDAKGRRTEYSKQNGKYTIGGSTVSNYDYRYFLKRGTRPVQHNYGNNDYRDYLQHARPHKYILKIGKGITARYFYTQEEINAFRKKAAPKLKKAGETYEQVAKGAAKKYGPELMRSVERHKEIGRSLKRTVTGSGKKQVESEKLRTAEKRAQLKNQRRAADNERRIQKEAYARGERNREKAFQLQNQKAARKANQKVTDKARRAYKRDRFIEDVKGDIANTRKSVSKSVNKAKKAAKQKWDISAPARAIRRAEYKRKKEGGSKRKARRKKVNKVINSVLRRG